MVLLLMTYYMCIRKWVIYGPYRPVAFHFQNFIYNGLLDLVGVEDSSRGCFRP